MYKITALLFCLLPLFSFAQKIDFKEDTLLVDNKAYALLLESGDKLKPSFVVQNLAGDDLITADIEATEPSVGNVSSVYVLTFVGFDDNIARITPAIPYKKNLAKNIVKAKLINTEGELDEKAVIRFCKVNYGEFKPAVTTSAADSNELSYVPGEYIIVERNTAEKVICASGNIRQDKKLVGKYKYETRSVKGLAENVVQFFSVNNIRVAEARYSTGSSTCELLLFRDSKKEKMEITTPGKAVDEIVNYLIDIGYL